MRGVVHEGQRSTDVMYHKERGNPITARFYVVDRISEERFEEDLGWFTIAAGEVRSYIFTGRDLFAPLSWCMEVQGQESFCEG